MVRWVEPVSYHFPCFADGLVLVCVEVFGGLLLLHLVHDGVDGEAEAGHARQVAHREVELQRAIIPRVVRAAAALAAHRRLAEQLRAVEEPRPHLDLADGRGLGTASECVQWRYRRNSRVEIPFLKDFGRRGGLPWRSPLRSPCCRSPGQS